MNTSKFRKIKEPLTRILTHIRNFDAILWAGSGLSLYAGYPSGTELTKRIIEAAANEKDKSILEYYKNSLMDVSNEFAQLYSKEKLVELLIDSFDALPSSEIKTHDLISKIPQLDIIVTTNYDHLFEIVYKDNITVNIGTKFKKSVRGLVDLYKIHGDTSELDSIIITSKDYAQFYEGLTTISWNKIKGLLAEKSVIFVGYSLEDKNIQDVFEKIITQIDSSDKEFFIVTPSLQEHKLNHLNTICKTTHIPLTGEEFIEYIEFEIRKNILLDAVAKKVTVDEAYKICRLHGIAPTIVNEPYGETTKAVVERIELSPQAFFDQAFFPLGRGLNFTSRPETHEAMLEFFNDCDCRELIIPAEDAVSYRDINGIHVPENQKINGKFPDVIKLEKQEMIEKLNLVLGENNSYGCGVCIRGYCGNLKSRITIELECMNICVVHDIKESSSNFNFSFRYPHSAENALADLTRLQFWCSGSDLVFQWANEQPAYIMRGLSNREDINELVSFVSDNIKLYYEIQAIENDLGDRFILDKEFTTDDIRHIRIAYSSLSPNTVKYTDNYSVNAGHITLKELELYNDHQDMGVMQLQMTYSDVLPEDCFSLFGKNIILGTRKIRILEPYVANFEEAKKAVLENMDVVLQFGSKKHEAILEYVNLPKRH